MECTFWVLLLDLGVALPVARQGLAVFVLIAPSDVIPNHTKPTIIMMTATHDTLSSGSFPENMARHVFMQLVEGPLARTAAHCPG